MTAPAGRLFDVIDSDREAMLRLLTALVSLPTENPPARAYLPCARLLEETLRSIRFDCTWIDIPAPADAPRVVLIASYGTAGPTLYFHGHYDVVPAATREQFEPRVDGDTMFGRGASDMKSGLVAMLFAAKALRDAGVGLRGRVELVFVPDEETGGRYGSEALSASGRLGQDGIGMLLPEPTSGKVWHANRGAISLRVRVKGRAAHVGLAHEGVSAVERALPIILELLDLRRELRNGSILLVGGRIEAGSNFNVVPAECSFTVDRRINPDENLDDERARLFGVFSRARSAGTDVDVEVIQEGRAACTPTDAPLACALRDSVAEITGSAPQFEMCPGLLETRFYVDRGVQALAYGPGILAVSHGPQEFVRISRMVECAKVYALTAIRALCAP